MSDDLDPAPEWFDTIEPALVAWGGYADRPHKVEAALSAFRQMVERLGQPANIYIVGSRQYVGVSWKYSLDLAFHSGFIVCRQYLGPSWQWIPEHRKFRFHFPDFRLRSGGERSSTQSGTCPCSPGVLVPVGSDCPSCGETVTI